MKDVMKSKPPAREHGKDILIFLVSEQLSPSHKQHGASEDISKFSCILNEEIVGCWWQKNIEKIHARAYEPGVHLCKVHVPDFKFMSVIFRSPSTF